MIDPDATDGAMPPGTTTTTPDATSGTAATGAMPSTSDDKGSDELRDAGVRALTVEREARQAAERRVAELEDASKSEVERLRSQLERITAERDAEVTKNAEHERTATKRRIASEIGLPHELAERLVGDDDHALRADAKRLLDLTAPSDGRLGAGHGGVTPTRGLDDMNTRIREASGR